MDNAQNVKQTAGRDQLGDFATNFAELNDDVLFGEDAFKKAERQQQGTDDYPRRFAHHPLRRRQQKRYSV